MRRRTFLAASGRGSRGRPPPRHGVFANRPGDRPNRRHRPHLQSLIADLEKQLPQLMADALRAGTVDRSRQRRASRVASRVRRGGSRVREAGRYRHGVCGAVHEQARVCVRRSETVREGRTRSRYPCSRSTLPDRVLAGDARLDLITARHVLSHTSRFSELALRDRAPEDSFRSRRAVAVLRRRLQLPAVGRDAPDWSCRHVNACANI